MASSYSKTAWKQRSDTSAGTGEDVSALLPKRLSPSRAGDFAQCPAKFYFRSILRLSTPATDATTKGTLVHEACEHVFDHPRGERTPDLAVTYIRPAWEQIKDLPDYAPLVVKGPAFIEQLLLDAEDLCRRWFAVEDPNRFDPAGRELRLEANVEGVDMLGIIDRLDRVVYPSGAERVIVSDYKGLALDTPLPTPTGWTTMAAVAVGDRLLGSDGHPCTVTSKSQVHHRRCYRLTFDDATSVVCDNEHLWQVSVDDGHGPVVKVLNTDELGALFDTPRHPVVAVANTAPLQLPPADVAEPLRGLAVAVAAGAEDVSVLTPALRASLRQRVEALSGLVESAGEWDPAFGQWVLEHRDAAVVDLAEELVVSLGGSSYRCGGGRGPQSAHFTVPLELPVGDTAPATAHRDPARRIESVAEVASVPTQCVAVDAPDSLYLAGTQMVPTHNTGKVPAVDDRYLDEKFFAMKVYAVLVREVLGDLAFKLRLIYVAGGTRDSVREMFVDDNLIKATRLRIKSLWSSMRKMAREGLFPTKVQPLCNWCDHQPLCPAWNPELAGADPDVLAELHAGELAELLAVAETAVQVGAATKG